MLVLQRRLGEVIVISVPGWPPIPVQVVDLRADKVRLGITAPPEVVVDREEVHLARMRGESRAVAGPGRGR
jgi:carbon storage regulator CsrA